MQPFAALLFFATLLAGSVALFAIDRERRDDPQHELQGIERDLDFLDALLAVGIITLIFAIFALRYTAR